MKGEGATSRSTAICTAAPARTSAARRPGCSRRSKASADGRGSSRPFLRSRASSAARRSSTTSRRSPRCRAILRARRRVVEEAWARESRSAACRATARSSWACPGTSTDRASTRWISASPLTELVEEHCGGMRGGKRFKGAIAGGVSHGRARDRPVRHADGLRHRPQVPRCMGLGTACPTVFDEDTDMVAVARNISRFFKNESCGQCTPCREGSAWIYKLLCRIERGDATTKDLDLLLELAGSMGLDARHDDLRSRRRQQLGGPHDRQQVPQRVRGAGPPEARAAAGRCLTPKAARSRLRSRCNPIPP